MQGLIVPHLELAPDTLRGVIEEFVTREGTDYGGEFVPLEDKIRQVRLQLDKGLAFIVYDPESESCTIASAREVKSAKPG